MAQRTIPTIASLPQLAQWQAGLRPTLLRPIAPRVTANVRVQSQQGGNLISWAAMSDADGYEVQVSEDGNFATVLNVVGIATQKSTTYFDTVPVANGGTPAKRFYRVNSTAGTDNQRHSVRGKPSATVSATAIAPNDIATAPATTTDTSNYDLLNANAGTGDYNRSFIG